VPINRLLASRFNSDPSWRSAPPVSLRKPSAVVSHEQQLQILLLITSTVGEKSVAFVRAVFAAISLLRH
jgi:hypothetical protein